jgi:putative nucleotidyltransferase with HDIG domain
LTLLSYPLVPLLERLFGFTSDITLDELSNLDQPLLKELSMKTPGTLQHSLQVGHLSEAAATEIGANALLVKVAALYHDIGKVNNPQFFIENQQRQGNPHDKLSPEESAKMIISHITEGMKKAKKGGLPKVVIEFIATHHGTTRVEYFYRKAQEENPDEIIDESKFRYPGPSPTSKEQVIMMLADSIEAASKSIQTPTEEILDDLVEKIVAGKIASQQLIHANITFEELDKVKKVFKRVLKSINHARIAYPDN